MRLGQCHSFSSQEFLRHEYYYKKMCVKKLFGVVKVTHAIEASGHMFYLMRFLASKLYEKMMNDKQDKLKIRVIVFIVVCRF